MLKNMLRVVSILHFTELELVHWHLINLSMLELGLWSRFKFKTRHDNDYVDFYDLLVISALKAKRICNDEADYSIY